MPATASQAIDEATSQVNLISDAVNNNDKDNNVTNDPIALMIANLVEQWTATVNQSRDLGTQIAVYGTGFNDSVVSVIDNNSVSPEQKQITLVDVLEQVITQQSGATGCVDRFSMVDDQYQQIVSMMPDWDDIGISELQEQLRESGGNDETLKTQISVLSSCRQVMADEAKSSVPTWEADITFLQSFWKDIAAKLAPMIPLVQGCIDPGNGTGSDMQSAVAQCNTIYIAVASELEDYSPAFRMAQST